MLFQLIYCNNALYYILLWRVLLFPQEIVSVLFLQVFSFKLDCASLIRRDAY